MHKYLPSKKFTLTFIAIILALIIIGAFFFLRQAKPAVIDSIKVASQTKTQEFMALDSDNDGLKDWEEALWKTDPKNPDTDGDGTPDGEEVKLNRDPLKANTAKAGETPTDLFDVKVVAANKKATEDFSKLSQTDQLARTFFSQYIASKSAGGAALSQTSKQIILDTAISMTQNSNASRYFDTDLKTIADGSSTTLKTYGNTLARAFFTGTSVEKVSNEMDIITKATQTQDEKTLDGLDPIIESYGKTINKILLISVPTEISSLHLKFLNDLSSLKTSLEEMKKLFSDPALAVGGIDVYQTSISNIKKDLSDLKSYFAGKEIKFVPGEYGYAFFNSI